MLVKTAFKKSTLSLSLSSILHWHKPQKRLCFSIFLAAFVQQAYANTTADVNTNLVLSEGVISTEQDLSLQVQPQKNVFLNKEEQPLGSSIDSHKMLQQQEQNVAQITSLQNIDLDGLSPIEHAPISSSLEAEIMHIAEQAKREAVVQREQQDRGFVVNDATVQELSDINRAPLSVDGLMSTIQAESQSVVQSNEIGKLPGEDETTSQRTQVAEQPGMFRRLWYKVRPPRRLQLAKVPKISADVQFVNVLNTSTLSDEEYQIALDALKTNIKAKLSSFSQESFADFNTALPQLRNLSRQAAQAVGFFQAEFRFQPSTTNKNKVIVEVTPNTPVLVASQNIEFSGTGKEHPRFQVIKVLPEMNVGEVFNQGEYQQTKDKINNAANDNGFFDSYWRLHDVRVLQPENNADINLRFETGERYRLGDVEFRMSDPTKPFPLSEKILNSLVTWEPGADYTFWRVNTLANNLTNSRYFNYTLVNAIKPDPIEKPLEFAPDIQKLIDENNLTLETDAPERTVAPETQQAAQTQVDENQFVGVNDEDTESAQERREMRVLQNEKRQEEERLKLEARKSKIIPVIVELNADKLNSAEIGLGFGTDTGPRVRGQYRRAIVNEHGHSFDANMEVSEIRQSIDGRYNIPYKHPLNDYIAIVGGYEREERDDVAEGNGIVIQSAVLGADRMIKRPMGNWQHTYGVRYRLDKIDIDGTVDPSDIPEAFLGGGSDKQQSLLFGYEVSRLDSDRRINPSKGIRQRYKLEVGSENVLTDVNMIIANAAWNAMYSFGETNDHQVLGRAELGYIFSDDFNKVPYNLRYFSGGDQSIRGFDYKSLSPEVDGYKVGGQALGIGSVEYNYQFKDGWRAALFADAGNAYNEDFSNPTEYGIGVGIRWASPIGSIRVDVASGVSDPGHPVRVHFFIGSQL